MKTKTKSKTSTANQRSYDRFVEEAKRYPLLTLKQESALAERAHSSVALIAAAAKRKLVNSNLRLVIKLARQYNRTSADNLMDLIQQGNLGLVEAAERFEIGRGTKFSSYAVYWIRCKILRHVMHNSRLVKIGTTKEQQCLFWGTSRATQALEHRGVEVTSEAIAAELDVPVKCVDEMYYRTVRQDRRLDADVPDIFNHEYSTTWHDRTRCLLPRQDTLVASAAITSALHSALEKFRARLTGRDVILFDRRMLCDEPASLQEIGTEHGVSKEAIRCSENKLRRWLKEHLVAELGGEQLREITEISGAQLP